jgi:uncharacterized protein
VDLSILSLAAAGLLIAGVVKGATGLGYATCALPFLVIAVGQRQAMALIILPAMATNVSIALSGGHFVETFRRFKTLYVSMLPGICVGIGLLLWVNQSSATHLLSIVIITYSLLALVKPQVALPKSLQSPLQIPTGFLNGVMTGATGAQVMPLFPYMMALGLEPDRMVQAINIAVLIASFALAIALAATGIMDRELFMVSLIAIAPALLGVEIGTRARRFLRPEQFKRIALLTLLLMGCMMLAR